MTTGPRKVGIIGAGYIADAVLRGVLGSGTQDWEFVLSPRGAQVVKSLVTDFPTSVSHTKNNQDILDKCLTVILAVRPSDAEEVLRCLSFRPDHHVVSVIAGFGLDRLKELIAPAKRVTMAIPLPSIAQGNGTTVLYPEDPDVARLFQCGGPVVCAKTEHAYACLGTATAIMASHFRFACAADDWLTANGVDGPTARSYVNALFSGLAKTGEASVDRDFECLAKEHAKPGSFNMFMLERLDSTGVFDCIPEALDRLLLRMLGQG